MENPRNGNGERIGCRYIGPTQVSENDVTTGDVIPLKARNRGWRRWPSAMGLRSEMWSKMFSTSWLSGSAECIGCRGRWLESQWGLLDFCWTQKSYSPSQGCQIPKRPSRSLSAKTQQVENEANLLMVGHVFHLKKINFWAKTVWRTWPLQPVRNFVIAVSCKRPKTDVDVNGCFNRINNAW